MNEFIYMGDGPEIFTERTLRDYSVLIDVENEFSTNHERGSLQKRQLEQLGHHFDIRHVTTTPDKFETALLIEEAMGDDASDSVIWARTGDGGNGGPLRAAVGRGAALWQANAGFANNLSRASFGAFDRIRPARIIDRGRIAITRPLECVIVGPDGELIYSDLLADEFGIGDMANGQTEREKEEHRAYFKKVGLIRRALRSAQVGARGIDACGPFDIIRGSAEEIDATVDPEIETFNELTHSNIGYIAWVGRIKDSSMAERKMVEISSSYQTKFGARLFFMKLYSMGVRGTDVYDGETVDYRLLTEANAQGSGDPFVVPAGSQVSIKRSDKELHVVTTRKHP